jgi:hypothetical protein
MRIYQRSRSGVNKVLSGALAAEMLLAATVAHINVFVAGTERLGLSTTKISRNWDIIGKP